MSPAAGLSPRAPWRGRRVVLGVTGGIAAYKSIQLARDLTRLGAEVDVVLTGGARRFVTPLSFEGVTGRPVLSSLFSVSGSARHISLGTEADLVIVAPASADFLARAAGGHASDLLSTTLLVTRAPVLVAPAMNDRMWAHPAVRANAELLRTRPGIRFVGPAEGALAAGEGAGGPGRMVEPAELVAWAGRALGDPASPLRGRRVLVTSGPTREAVDAVRYLGNRSSGRMGQALAVAAWMRGAEVDLITGPVELPDPPGIRVEHVETAREMFDAVSRSRPLADVSVFAAAVADFRIDEPHEGKMKRTEGDPAPELRLIANPDIALETRGLARPGSITVGFALESSRMLDRAREKLRRKGFDLVVANATGVPGTGFGAADLACTLIGADGSGSDLGRLPKEEVAETVLSRIEELLDRSPRE